MDSLKRVAGILFYDIDHPVEDDKVGVKKNAKLKNRKDKRRRTSYKNKVKTFKMQPWGAPVITCPDVADIHYCGCKPSIGSLPGKNGDIRNIQSASNKKITRRFWKKRARSRVQVFLRKCERELA